MAIHFRGLSKLQNIILSKIRFAGGWGEGGAVLNNVAESPAPPGGYLSELLDSVFGVSLAWLLSRIDLALGMSQFIALHCADALGFI